jgi:TRAP-type mannitol/chloroaromatic compound transport system permease small subunit
MTKGLDNISNWTGMLFAWLIWIVMGLCVFEVITRRIFNAPNIWSYDVTSLFYAMHFMLLAGYTLLHQGHVAVDILYVRFSPRVQAVMKLIGYLVFFFPFILVLVYVGIKSSGSSWEYQERTAVGIPLVMPIMKTITPVTALLLLLQGISEFIKGLLVLKTGGEGK